MKWELIQIVMKLRFLEIWLSPVMFNSFDGIIQLQKCSNVISAPGCAVDSGQISVWNKFDIYSFDKFCKYNMLGMHLDLNFQDLITNQEVLPFNTTAMITCIIVEKLSNQK